MVQDADAIIAEWRTQVPERREGETDNEYSVRYMRELGELRGWPDNVETLGILRLEWLGIDPKTKQLYWDGQPVVTKHELGRREFFLASLAAWSTAGATLIAAVALLVSAFKG